jgi:hypothetical protein
MRNLKSVLLLALLFFAWPQLGSAQITITADDLLGQIGSRQVGLEDRRGSIPVDVGSPGANQVWDFRTQIIGDTLFSVSEFLMPDETVSASTFPAANMVQKITSPTDPGFEIFNFYNLTSEFFINLGDSSNISAGGFDTTFVFFQNDTLAPFPVAFGNTWLTTEIDTTGFYPINANISIDTTLNTVDGWGTVRLPMGDFECLRLRQDAKVINQTIINGTLFSTSVDSFIQYDWISRDIFRVVSAQSQNNDMNPNFTDAQGFGRLDSLSTSPPTSVEDPGDLTQIPSDFELFQNYPNPFNPSTTISFDLSSPSEVTLHIYNLKGQLVRTLVDGKFNVGRHSVVWDGRDQRGGQATSGLYVTRMQAGQFVQHHKMLLIK